MLNIHRTLDISSGTVQEKRQEIKDYFLATLALEDSLFKTLKDDDSFYQKPEPLRHPLIFYYGHTFTFYINKLYTGKYISHRINPEFESICAVGVDEMSWDDLDEKNYPWPSVSQLRIYRGLVKERVLEYIENCTFEIPIRWDSPMWPILMGIEHHRIHIETSSVLIRQMSIERIQSQKEWTPCPDIKTLPPKENKLLPVFHKSFQIGKSPSASTYGWDNEYGQHQVSEKNFFASEHLVSNSEFFEFWKSGGYQKNEYWTEEGQKWKEFKKAKAPHFWILDLQGQPSHLRCLDRVIEMPWSWPVEVNYLEAKAFCEWKSQTTGKPVRLPTEDEWQSLLKVAMVQPEATTGANLALRFYPSSCPVNRFKQGEFFDVIGNVWQWTETPIYPFNGFKVHPLYDDFSVPTFDGKHNLIKGGSWISTGNEELPESRYAFRRHFFQHAGFRYVSSKQEVKIEVNPYETDTLLSQYCEFHYGHEYFKTPNFPKQCIEKIRPFYSLLKSKKRALDLGCALGRSTLELSLDFDQVVGLDFSTRFIDRTIALLNDGVLRYGICAEGEILEYYERTLHDHWTPSQVTVIQNKFKNGSLEFYQGDACNLQPKFTDYDLVFAGNLIDRLYSPRAFLKQIRERLNRGGLLVLTSPYTWLAEYTPKEEWLGGFKKNGENLTTLQALQAELDSHFKMVTDPIQIPFVLRETKNKFQHTLAEMTIWQKI